MDRQMGGDQGGMDRKDGSRVDRWEERSDQRELALQERSSLVLCAGHFCWCLHSDAERAKPGVGKVGARYSTSGSVLALHVMM